MPRAKPKISYPVAWIEGVLKIDPKTAIGLINYAGLDATDPSVENRERIKGLIMGVVEILGQHRGMTEVLDRAPRPGNIRAAMQPIQKHGRLLLTILDDLDAESWSLLKDTGWDHSITRNALLQLQVAVETVCNRLLERESRHAPRKDALRITIVDLARLYDHFREPDSEPAAEADGPVTNSASAKRRFVVTALRAAKISAGRNLIDEALSSPQADLYRPRNQGILDPSDRSSFVIRDPNKPPDQQFSLGKYLTIKEDQVLGQLRRLGFAPEGEKKPTKGDISGSATQSP